MTTGRRYDTSTKLVLPTETLWKFIYIYIVHGHVWPEAGELELMPCGIMIRFYRTKGRHLDDDVATTAYVCMTYGRVEFTFFWPGEWKSRYYLYIYTWYHMSCEAAWHARGCTSNGTRQTHKRLSGAWEAHTAHNDICISYHYDGYYDTGWLGNYHIISHHILTSKC